MLVTKAAFKWVRTFSCAGSGTVEIPAGAPVEWNSNNQCYYVSPVFFNPVGKGHTAQNILEHDAIHYGCHVSPDNILDAAPLTSPDQHTVPDIEALMDKGYKYSVQFEEDGKLFGEPLAFKRVEDISSFMWTNANLKMVWQKELQRTA